MTAKDVGLFVNSWTHETVFLFSEQSIKFANALLDTKHKSIRKKRVRVRKLSSS